MLKNKPIQFLNLSYIQSGQNYIYYHVNSPQPQVVAKINDTLYFSLDEAVDAAQIGDVIDLLTDVNLEGKHSKEWVTIDANGHKVTATSHKYQGKLVLPFGSELTLAGKEFVGSSDGFKLQMNAGATATLDFDANKLTLNGSALVPTGQTLVLDPRWFEHAEIANGATLDVAGTLKLASGDTIGLDAVINGNLNIQENGGFVLAHHATLVANSGASIDMQAFDRENLKGLITVKEGATLKGKLKFGDKLIAKTVVGPEGSDAAIALKAGEIELNFRNRSLMTLKSGGRATVQKGQQLSLLPELVEEFVTQIDSMLTVEGRLRLASGKVVDANGLVGTKAMIRGGFVVAKDGKFEMGEHSEMVSNGNVTLREENFAALHGTIIVDGGSFDVVRTGGESVKLIGISELDTIQLGEKGRVKLDSTAHETDHTVATLYGGVTIPENQKLTVHPTFLDLVVVADQAMLQVKGQLRLANDTELDVQGDMLVGGSLDVRSKAKVSSTKPIQLLETGKAYVHDSKTATANPVAGTTIQLADGAELYAKMVLHDTTIVGGEHSDVNVNYDGIVFEHLWKKQRIAYTVSLNVNEGEALAVTELKTDHSGK
ncbi:MAG: hypothetical protein Q4A52_07875, partial [Bacillota bacterium]|nr:hypothetical protein [Bacillota bacterium]